MRRSKRPGLEVKEAFDALSRLLLLQKKQKTSLSPLGSLSSIYKVQGSVAHWICQGISFGTDVLGVSFILTSPSLEFFFSCPWIPLQLLRDAELE